ncbi:MAG: FAD-binding oxidoreductase [Candidatus Andersenbacteria bacterium]|nr:FAD-binding oxidoreductase [Candidatus Andersenbacteria bacterium]MBI3250897.1 FAD-binding oxidoreductase [Candidatus Andersenbacteria bacterium]
MGKVKETPIWDEGVQMSHFPALTGSEETEVAIIGGGIAGLSAAYLLSQAGIRSVLLEENKIGHGATGVTTAFLTQYIDTEINDLIAMFGQEKARAIFASHAAAIDIIEQIIAEERIDCEFTRCVNYIYANSEDENKKLLDEEKVAHDLGVEMQFKARGLPFTSAGYLELPRQAKFHPLKYVKALVNANRGRGVTMYEETEVKSITSQVSGVLLKTAGGSVHAKHAIVATYAPFDKKLYFKKAFYTTYIIQGSLPKKTVAEGIYEDMANPYHYFRVDRNKEKDRVILGGADHRSDIPMNAEKNFTSLEDYAKKLFPDVSFKVDRRWSGPIIESVDGLAFIGPMQEKNVFYATGFSGNGMTYGTIAAKMATDYIKGRSNPWQSLYDPMRVPTVKQLAYKGQDYTRELFGGAVKNTIGQRD